MKTLLNNTPKTLQENILFFADKDRALEFMVSLRWPDGITCPICGSEKHSFISTRRVWKCKSCKKQFSVKVGTVMEDSPLGLDKWLCAFWLIANAKNGISSYEIHRALSITQKTAWFLLHRIRLAMRTGTFEKMSGSVEADETFIGGLSGWMHADKRAQKIKGSGWMGKSIVMGLLERETQGKGKGSQVRAMVVGDTKTATLQGEVKSAVEAGANVYTDTHSAYVGLSPEYIHESVCHAANEYVRDAVHTNGLENFWALMKRCIKGTYIHVDVPHLFRYLDEETFRFNERKGNDRDRFLSATEGMIGKRITYKQLIGKTEG